MNENKIILIRYLDFPKFISFLTEGLFIPRADMFEDKLEGIIPYPDAENAGFTIYDKEITNLLIKLHGTKSKLEVFEILHESIEEYLHKYPFIKNILYDIRRLLQFSEKIYYELSNRNSKRNMFVKKHLREMFFNLHKETYKANLISCWYNSSEENIAMWNLYSKTEGVAIQTTIKKVERLIKDNRCEFNSGLIKYDKKYSINFNKWKDIEFFNRNIKKFEKEDSKYNYPEYWLFKKRFCFKHEEEFRFIIKPTPSTSWYCSYEPEQNIDKTDIKIIESFGINDPEKYKKRAINNNSKNFHKNGFHLKICNYNDLLDKIVLAPNMPKYFEDTIKQLLKKMNQNELFEKVTKSKISAVP